MATQDIWISDGANGASGTANRFTRSGYGGYYLAETVTLTGADAIEGIHVGADGTIVAVNDAYFHSGNPALKGMLRFSA